MKKRQADLIKEMNDHEVLLQLYITQFVILALALCASIFLFPDANSFFQLWDWKNIEEIIYYGGGAALIVIIIDIILMKIVPKEMYDDGGVNEKIFKKRPIWHIFIICLLVAFSEEFLFRAVIQTHFGYLIASIIFAFLHLRYLYKWLLFIVVTTLSFYIGWIYVLTENVVVTIFMHFLIDFIFALMIRLQIFREF
ncbi:CPBP family intramembrane glutamic endopeptidase [Calidifontibacillus erzurumensis]|uniref:CPBP family intramembrane metalloprotease n=1 Tax=Calidifontibacillus erzurumensis TaxID=2741433 RepID=A0A8J8K788_9BACI|nr:CPBP family intramembrane glutamic endopeptidase [Calidifontibacillus erzurumensis]NSL50496.1 CPBP family intramembrane metalloprotease [Calidifontibacillus erzurumensis]